MGSTPLATHAHNYASPARLAVQCNPPTGFDMAGNDVGASRPTSDPSRPHPGPTAKPINHQRSSFQAPNSHEADSRIPDLRGHGRAQSSRLAVSFAIDQHRSGHRERCLFQMQPKLLETSLRSTPHAAAVAHHSYRLFSISPPLHAPMQVHRAM